MSYYIPDIFSTLSLKDTDESRLQYLKSELKKRAFAPKSYAWFLDKVASYHDKWLLLPSFKINDEFYFQFLHLSSEYFIFYDVLVWPPKPYYVMKEFIVMVMLFDQIDQVFKSEEIYNLSIDYFREKGYREINSPYLKEVIYFFEPDVEYAFLRTPLQPFPSKQELVTEILDQIKFPLLDSTIDANAPSKKQILELDSVAFYTHIYTTLLSDSFDFEEFLSEDVEIGIEDKFLNPNDYYCSNENFIASIIESDLPKIVRVSLFNLVTYINSNLGEWLLELEEATALELSSDMEMNDELLLRLTG